MVWHIAQFATFVDAKGERLVRSNARSSAVAVVALLGTLLSPSSARAEDYSVEYGVDSTAGRDAGTLTCQFEETCAARMESLGLRVTFYLSRRYPFPRDSDQVSVQLDDDKDISCCFFADAADSIKIDLHQKLSRVPFFRGVRARGALLIENERVGTLYLKFHSH